ncbi:CheY-like chemotaxis protein/LmbE family N-acetylglucosaminyl deacetylase [Conyzicola nivalis]|uniref:CheY-like chemotaxis protein/LmbE family N-acetylglucosaminyl deacetylase n=1 Tax=Conyzicola nivalis TaxID=1477021 RepID=A0ABV2QHX1_9MICO
MAEAYRVVVVEDDADVAFYTKTVLEKRGGCEVVTVADPSLARGIIAEFKPDVVVTDIEMPGLNGLELMAQIRSDQPGIPIVVMTAHISVDYAVGALNGQADEFLIKPISAADLVAAVMRLAADSRANRGGSGTRASVLAVGVHPDDVEIGVGGILAAHRAAGDTVTIVTLTRGNASAGSTNHQSESLAAAELIGARLFLEDIAESDISAGGSTADAIARAIAEVSPTVVYTHSAHDDSRANRAANEATLAVAASVPSVFAFQSPSSTVDFRPSKFVSIDGHTDTKLTLVAHFTSQADVRTYRDPELVLATARYWGRFGGGTSVEPLEVLREAAPAAAVADAEPAVVTLGA